MKTFKKFITEGSATEIKELIFTDSEYEYPIPFSQPMWERITNFKSEGYGMHVTDMEDVIKLAKIQGKKNQISTMTCLLYTSPSPRDGLLSRMPSSA